MIRGLRVVTVGEIIMADEGKPGIDKTHNTLRIMSFDEENRRLYEAERCFFMIRLQECMNREKRESKLESK